MFNIISRYVVGKDFKFNSFDSIHILQRNQRLVQYRYLLSTDFIDCFIVDTNHRNGLEIHCINKYGLIYIYNKLSMKLITILHPRPTQMKRYYVSLGLTVSKEIKKLSRICYERNVDRSMNEV